MFRKMFRKSAGICLSLIMIVLSVPLGSTAMAESSDGDHLGHIVWPQNQELPTFAKPSHLDVIDVTNASGDDKLMLASLQGIVNREQPRIYLIEGNPSEGKYTWLKDSKVPYTIVTDEAGLVAKYKDEVKGLIIYDPNLPDSINVATTMAGIENGIVVSPEFAQKFEGEPYKFPVLEDLRGRFANRLDAYTWEFEHLWSKTTHRMLIGLSPNTGVGVPPNNWDSFQTILQEPNQIRDASNRKVYDMDLSQYLGKDAVFVRFQDAFPQDGWGPAVHQVTVKADGQIIAQFVPGTTDEQKYLYDSGGSAYSSGIGGHRFADGGGYFVYRFAPPAGTKSLVVSVDMWNQFKVSASNTQPLSSDARTPFGYLRDYAVANRAMVFWLDPNKPDERALFEKIMSDVQPGTPYLGWFANDVSGEFNGTELTSKHGVFVLAADWFNNMSVLSGVKGKTRKQPSLPTPKLDNKIYVTFTFSEGDNLQYDQHRMRQIWDDQGRGSVPINWTIDPLLSDAAPIMLSHYEQTATPNDLLIAGPSGAGYFYPNAWPDASFDAYMKLSNKYLLRSGLNIAYVLNRTSGQNVPLSPSKAQAYIDDLHLNGLFLSWENNTQTTILNGSLPQSIILGAGSVSEAEKVIADASSGWDGKSPKFISVGVLAWSNTPTDIANVAKSLGPQYQVVRGDQYFQLVRQTNGLPAYH